MTRSNLNFWFADSVLTAEPFVNDRLLQVVALELGQRVSQTYALPNRFGRRRSAISYSAIGFAAILLDRFDWSSPKIEMRLRRVRFEPSGFSIFLLAIEAKAASPETHRLS